VVTDMTLHPIQHDCMLLLM